MKRLRVEIKDTDNVFTTIEEVCKKLDKAGRTKQSDEMMSRIGKGANSYDEIMDIMEEYVEIEYKEKSDE